MIHTLTTKGNPKLGEGIYSIKDVATILRLPLPKVKRWFADYWLGIMSEVHHQQYMWGDGKQSSVNFYGLIEFYTFYHLRNAGISPQRILEAYKAIADFKKTPYPFAASEILTDGGNILFKYDQEILIDADKGLVTRMHHLLKEYCQNIDFDKNRLALRLYPMGRSKKIVIDPQHQFGQPTIVGTNIYPDTIFHLFKAGEKAEVIARLYELSDKQVHDAITYCERAA